MENTQPVVKKQSKWTKEYAKEYQREYMRNRWRRVHGVKPENFKENRTSEIEEKAAELGEAAVKLLEFQKQLKKYKPVPKTVCKYCFIEYYDTEGSLKMHQRNRYHKIAVEVLGKHGHTIA